jgi:hypothetical protein
MPFNIDRDRSRWLGAGRSRWAIPLATLVLTLAGAGSAQALTLALPNLGSLLAVNPIGVSTAALQAAEPCTAPAEATPFTQWGDTNSYTLAPGGSFESGAPWVALGGASVVADNEPWYATGNTSDDHALALPSGSTAVSAPMCVSLGYPDMRLFARRMSGSGSLDVDVLYVSLLDGQVHALPLAALTASDGNWFVTGQIPLLVNTLSILSPGGVAPVAFAFTPSAGSSWRIDDVYVDPFRRS